MLSDALTMQLFIIPVAMLFKILRFFVNYHAGKWFLDEDQLFLIDMQILWVFDNLSKTK